MNKRLVKELDDLKEEMKIVDWYIQVLESGKNTKTLLKDYIES